MRDASGLQVPIVGGPGGRCGAAEPSADGRRVLYGSSPQLLGEAVDQNAPADADLRMVDLVTGVDRLVAAHACGASWSADGRISYLDLTSGSVHVRSGVEGPVQVWSDPGGNLLPLGWAGSQLLGARCHDGDCSEQSTTAVVIEGPGQVRVLDASRSTGVVDAVDRVVAINPAGTQALTYLEGLGPPQLDGLPERLTQLRLVDVASGSVLDLINADVPPSVGLWEGDMVVALQGPGQFRSRAGTGISLITIRAQHLGFRPGITLPEERSDDAFTGARFTDDAQQTVEAWWGSHRRDELFICATATLECKVGIVEANGAMFLDRTSRP